MAKIVCFDTKCTDGKIYLVCAPEEIMDDVLNEYRDHCDPPEIRSINIDLVEIVSPKGKIKTQSRENMRDILDIEIR